MRLESLEALSPIHLLDRAEVAQNDATKLVEKVEDEGDVIMLRGAWRLLDRRERDPLPVRVQVEHPDEPTHHEAPGGPDSRVLGPERIAQNRKGRDHDLSVKTVEKLAFGT